MANYSIVRLRGAEYPSAIDNVYKKRHNLINQSFQEQHKAFLEEFISYPSSFSASMNELGNDSHEIYFDCQIMQQTWARERDLKYDENQWQTDILLAQLRDFQPDVVYFQDIFSMPQKMRIALKELVPSVRLKVIHKGAPGETRDLSDADILTVSSPILYERYKNLRPYMIYHSFDDAVLKYLGEKFRVENEQRIEFSFMGSVFESDKRHWMLQELMQKTNLRIWGLPPTVKMKKMKVKMRLAVKKVLAFLYGSHIPSIFKSKPFPKKLKNLILEIEDLYKEGISYGIDIDRLPNKPLKEMYPYRCHGPVFGIEYYQLLQSSNIVFNMHHSVAKNTVDNMRMFEGTGVGSCLLTNAGTNMKDIFEEDKEIVAYRSIDEAVEKASYLQDHPNVAEEIAKAGQTRTLRDHTTMNRCRQIDEILQKHL